MNELMLMEFIFIKLYYIFFKFWFFNFILDLFIFVYFCFIFIYFINFLATWRHKSIFLKNDSIKSIDDVINSRRVYVRQMTVLSAGASAGRCSFFEKKCLAFGWQRRKVSSSGRFAWPVSFLFHVRVDDLVVESVGIFQK